MAKTSHVEAAADGDDWLVVPCESHASVKVEPEDDGSVEETRTLNQDRLQTEPEPGNVAVQSFQPENRAFYQLLVWHSGLKEPLEVQDDNQKPLLVIVDKSCSMKELQKIVCDRLDDKTPWKPHQFDEEPKELIDSENNGEFADVESCNNNCVDGLLFASPTMVLDKSELHQLLVETRFLGTNGEGLTDWRRDGDFSGGVDGQVPPTPGEMIPLPLELLEENSKDENWRFQLEVGELVDALDTDNVWYESRVVAVSSTLVKLHYRGWTSKWDEWVERTSTRIAPLHTKVCNWRAFKVYDEVLVGRNVPSKKYPEWRNAVVTVVAREVDGPLRIEVEVDGSKMWLDAQDELLCPPGTHKAVNASVLTPSSSLF
ncbi:hypothetical protein BBP00_00008548 [Phytophthora kernoviae]|uniref:DUSP domain-containing protein n=1 Tax=Phytophthora kernoviae TaxID=325452 RepID=A0A3F2RH63_9STRA|nr:hypothetical protein BBP00_00008548 [Phytophthora kernoviae]